jgi:hypothetical protein
MEVGMSVDEYAKLVFTMITSLAIIVLVMALVMDEDQVALEEETVEN